MKVNILTYSISETTSGQARFAKSLAIGLQKAGTETGVISVWANRESLLSLTLCNVRATSLRLGVPTRLERELEILRPKSMNESLASRVDDSESVDWNIVLSDEIVGVADCLSPHINKVYICNGDMMLLFFNDAFYTGGRFVRALASATAPLNIRSHARSASKYDLRMANSEFTRHFMSYLYGIPFSGVCYPPVDLSQFRPRGLKSSPRFALSLMRNQNEQGIELMNRLAQRVPLKIVGDATVPGATSLGKVIDSHLADLYSQASVVVTPNVSEFFGYSVAEALASGTPVIAHACCGPNELIQDGVNGWVAHDSKELVEITSRVIHSGYPTFICENARRSVEDLGQRRVAERLTHDLESF